MKWTRWQKIHCDIDICRSGPFVIERWTTLGGDRWYSAYHDGYQIAGPLLSMKKVKQVCEIAAQNPEIMKVLKLANGWKKEDFAMQEATDAKNGLSGFSV